MGLVHGPWTTTAAPHCSVHRQKWFANWWGYNGGNPLQNWKPSKKWKIAPTSIMYNHHWSADVKTHRRTMECSTERSSHTDKGTTTTSITQVPEAELQAESITSPNTYRKGASHIHQAFPVHQVPKALTAAVSPAIENGERPQRGMNKRG